jgi:outer membrane protein assembly factor BamB
MNRPVWLVASRTLLIALALATFISCGHKGSHGTQSATGGLPSPKPAKEVALQDVLRDIDAYPVPKGVSAQTWTMLTAELKRLLIARAAGSKTISIEPTGNLCKVTDLAAASDPAGTQATVTWTEALAGDCNNDGEVSIADLQPIAAHYGETSSGPGSPAYLADADESGEVGITDLQPIAADYSMHIEGYEVWRGHYNGASTDWEATFRPNVGNPANTSFSADRPSPAPVSTRPAYTYLDDISGLADKTNVRYKVTAYGDGAAGAESNEAIMPPPSGGLANSAWPKFRGNYRNTGLSPYVGAQTNSLKWSYATGNHVFSSPAIAVDGTIYVGSYDYNVYALNPDGSVKWQHATGGAVDSSPAIGGDGTVYVGSGDENVYALNPDGSTKWSYQTGAEVNSSPAVGPDGTVYVGSLDRNVYALNPGNGSVKWTYTTNHYVRSSPAISNDGTIYVGNYSGNVYALKASDGSLKWVYPTGDIVCSSAAVGADGTVYIGEMGWGPSAGPRPVYALNSDGTVKWSFMTGARVFSSPAIGADGTVYVGSMDGNVYALNPSDGSVKWSYATGGPVWSSPAIGADGTVYVGSNDGKVYALNPADGSVKWMYATGASVGSSPAIGADGTVYVGSDDDNVYAFGP